jgi:hypothetical protein
MYFKEESDLIVEDNEEAKNCADDWENSLASVESKVLQF